eukprot:2048829-Amphidinium_carterae.1
MLALRPRCKAQQLCFPIRHAVSQAELFPQRGEMQPGESGSVEFRLPRTLRTYLPASVGSC